MPLVELNAGAGPSVFIGITIHGNELTGQASFWRLRSHLESHGVVGKITIIPVMNPEGFNFNVRGIPQSTADLNRLYPGDPTGSIAERNTAKIWEIARKAEVVVDVHTAGVCIPFILIDPITGDLRKRVEDLAYVTGVTVLDEYTPEKYELRKLASSLPGVALKEGIPSFTLELGGFYGIDWKSVEAGFIALKNVLIKTGNLEGQLETIESVTVIRERGYRREDLTSSKGGIIEHLKSLGDRVTKGDAIAKIRDTYGNVVEEVQAPTNGFIIALNGTNLTRTGGGVATLAVKS